MVDAKIPKELRDGLWLLADGQHILWVVGYRISQEYKVTENTKRILQVQLLGGKEHGTY
jgi:tRNA(Ile)-lysidine synthase